MRYFLGLLSICMAAVTGPCHAQTGGESAGAEAPEFNIANIKRGKQFFAVHCISCHGADGRGDTEMREFLKTPPADLTDDQWVYGDGDGAIFDVVKEGKTARDMPAFNDKLNDERIWQVINYVRYLGGRRP